MVPSPRATCANGENKYGFIRSIAHVNENVTKSSEKNSDRIPLAEASTDFYSKFLDSNTNGSVKNSKSG